MEPLVWSLALGLFGCGYILQAYSPSDHSHFAGQVLQLVGCVGLFGGLLAAAHLAAFGVVLGFAVGIAHDDKCARHPLRERLNAWLDKQHWKGPGPRNDAPPL